MIFRHSLNHEWGLRASWSELGAWLGYGRWDLEELGTGAKLKCYGEPTPNTKTIK